MRYTFPVAVIVLLLLMMFMNAHFIRRIESFEANAGYYLSGDGSWAGQMRPAAASADGSTGLVPSPLAGEHNSYLRGDGKWIRANNAPTAAQYLFARGSDGQAIPSLVFTYLSFPFANTVTATGTTAIIQNTTSQFTILPGYSYKITATLTNLSIGNDNGISVGIYINDVQQGQVGAGTPTSNVGRWITDTTSVCYISPTSSSTVKLGFTSAGASNIGSLWMTIEVVSNNNTITAFTGATSAKDGTIGYLPAPKAGSQNSYLRGDGTWQLNTGVTVQENVSANRGFDSVYRNTSGKTMFVSVSNHRLGGNHHLQAFSDSNNPPTTRVAHGFGDSGGAGIFFLVINNNYYSVGADSRGGDIWTWIEWY